MPISINYAEPNTGDYTDNSLVAFYYDEHSVTIVPRKWPGYHDEDRGGVVGFLERGGTIGAYVPPLPPPTDDEIDIKELNSALTQPGSVVRALAEIVFGMQKGTIPVTPTLTKLQFIAALKARMR